MTPTSVEAPMKFLIVMVTAVLAAIPVLAGERRLASPNGRDEVRVRDIGNRDFPEQESRIELRTRSGHVECSRSFGSADGQHGFGLRRGTWTPDGRWFVFNMVSSGGHQPWHVPTYAFDVRSGRLLELDAFIGPVMSDFELSGTDTLAVTRMNLDTHVPNEAVVVHLNGVARRAR